MKFSSLDTKALITYFIFSCMGIFIGFVISIFDYLVEGLKHLVLRPSFLHYDNFFYNFDVFTIESIKIVFCTTLGGFLSALFVYYKKIKIPLNYNMLIESFHRYNGYISFKHTMVNLFSSFFVLSLGSPTGKLGPISILGGGIASFFSKGLRMNSDARKTMLLVGMSASIGAIFKSPLGAAIMVTESLYKKDMESNRLIPCLVASSTSYLVYGFFNGYGALFKITDFNFQLSHIFIYMLLSFYCILVISFYIFFFRKTQFFFKNWKIPIVIKGSLGGLIFGIVGLFFPILFNLDTFNIKFFFNENIFHYNLLFLSLLFFLITLLKTIVLSIFVNSNGGIGGTFAALLNIGGFIGASFGSLMCYFFPDIFSSIIPFILIGMCGFYSGISKNLIGIVIMFLEITGDLNMIPAFVFVSLLTIIFVRDGIYDKQIFQRDNKK